MLISGRHWRKIYVHKFHVTLKIFSSKEDKHTVPLNFIHILRMNFPYSMLGYGVALTFKSIHDADIEKIQNFVKTELLEDLMLRYSNGIQEANISSSYCGKYAQDPSQFVFSPVEKAAVKCFSSFVKQIVDEPYINAGLDHFNKFKALAENIQSQRFFGEKIEGDGSKHNTRTHNAFP